MEKQLAGQQAGMNAMTVQEYLDGRQAFEQRKVETGSGRSGGKPAIDARCVRTETGSGIARTASRKRSDESALDAWIGDMPLMESDAYYVIARSAFGELFLWGSKSGQSLDIKCLWGMIFQRDNSERVAQGKSDFLLQSSIAGQDRKNLDQKDYMDKPLFERARKALGPLAPDEMYGFEPALAVGGKADLKNLRKVKTVAHLVMLAQLGDREIMRDIVKDAKGQGLL